jgi:hypothetical protein
VKWVGAPLAATTWRGKAALGGDEQGYDIHLLWADESMSLDPIPTCHKSTSTQYYK